MSAISCDLGRRGLGGVIWPNPKANHAGDSRSAFANSSTVAKFGTAFPFSICRTCVPDEPARRPTSRSDRPCVVRASRNLSGRLEHLKLTAGAVGWVTPKASRQGETPSASARRSTVSTRGMCSRLSSKVVVVRLASPACRASAACDSLAARRAVFSRCAKPK